LLAGAFARLLRDEYRRSGTINLGHDRNEPGDRPDRPLTPPLRRQATSSMITLEDAAET